MIIIRLIGGLGNQMFQYAFGRSLSIRKGVGLKFDLSFLNDSTMRPSFTKRNFELNVFDIPVEIASVKELEELKNHKPGLADRIHYRLKNRPVPYYCYPYIQEQFFHFDTNVFKAPSSCFYEGYWQTEKYFAMDADAIRKDFTLKKISTITLQFGEKISAANAVSIHIRRGDYVSNSNTNAYHGVCDMTYYKNAIDHLIKNTTNPVFFIFSDDMTWVRQNLKLDGPVTYIDFNNDKCDCEDMYLMSLCKHNIIANSSFSWWGAWLNKNMKKIVVAPKKWFLLQDLNTGDLLPPGWVQL